MNFDTLFCAKKSSRKRKGNACYRESQQPKTDSRFRVEILLLKMSSNSSLLGTNNDTGTQEALIIGAAIVAMLVFLAALRFVCNIFIDIVILENVEAARRSMAEAFRWAFPLWHVRTQPTDTATSVEMQHGNQTISSPVALTTKILTKADFQEHKTTSHRRPNHVEEVESVSSHTLMCSICLHDFHEGESAYIGPCDHIFHKECILQWVESRGRDCPNCRSEIIPSPIAVHAGNAPPLEN